MATWRYEISLQELKEIFSRLGNFQHSKRNFVSPGGHVISSIYGNGGMTVNFWTDQTFLVHNRHLQPSNSLSTHSKMKSKLWWTVSYKSLYFVTLHLEWVRFFIGMRKRSIVFFRDNEKLLLHFIALTFAGNTYVMKISIKFQKRYSWFNMQASCLIFTQSCFTASCFFVLRLRTELTTYSY